MTAVSLSSRVEAYRGKPILYGSGPFVDDYWLYEVNNCSQPVVDVTTDYNFVVQ